MGFLDKIQKTKESTGASAQQQLDANAFNAAVAANGGDGYTRSVLAQAYGQGGMAAVNAAAEQLQMDRGTHPNQALLGNQANSLAKQSAERIALQQSNLRGAMGAQGVRGGEAGRFMTNLAAQGEQSQQGISADLGLKLKQLQDAKAQRDKEDNYRQFQFNQAQNVGKPKPGDFNWVNQLAEGAGIAAKAYKAL